MMRELIPYQDYSREEVHNIFDPEASFTPQAGTWGLQGIVQIPERPRDYAFFVTFGQKQAEHEFDEGITADGVLRWQSQPQQRLTDRTIQNLITHDHDVNSIYLFLRTAKKLDGFAVPYTYLGRLKYLDHDRDREHPVYFTWQIVNWNLPTEVQRRMNLVFERPVGPEALASEAKSSDRGLIEVPIPQGASRRTGMSSADYAIHVRRDYADQDAKNRRLGLAGEEAVIEAERKALIAAGRQDLADRILHVAKVEGDGAGYDVKSFRSDGQEKFIEVKTTRGDEQTAFYVSANEVQFSACHSARYYLYRIFEFDQEAGSGKVFVHRGNLAEMFTLRPTNFKAALLPSS